MDKIVTAEALKVYVPHSEAEYGDLVALLDSMVDEVGDDESHPPR